MVAMQSMNWCCEGWELWFAIHEGVYHLDHYPLRISHLALTGDPRIRTAIATVGTGLLEQHMRRGSVAPHSMVLDWSRAHDVCDGSSPEMIKACHIIEAGGLAETGGGVSNHF